MTFLVYFALAAVILIALIAVGAIMKFAFKHMVLNVLPCDTKPDIVAHRGFAALYPENTIAAFQQAIFEGAKYIELDVHVTKDGIPIVHHDTTLERMYGIDLNVVTSTWGDIELQNIYHELCNVSTLSEVVQLIKAYPEVTWFVEIKDEGFSDPSHSRDHDVNAILDVLEPVHNQVVIISFDPGVCSLVRERNRAHDVVCDCQDQSIDGAKFKYGLVVSEYSKQTLDLLEQLECDYAFIDKDILPNEFKGFDQSFIWCVYEVKTIREANELHRKGAQLIETMEVAKLIKG